MPNNRLMDTSDQCEIILAPDPRKMRDSFVKQHFDVPGTVREVMNQTILEERNIQEELSA